MTVKRITSKKPHKLMQDDSCHWYLVPFNRWDEFEVWLTQDFDEFPDNVNKFDEFKINGPHTLKIYSWAEDG